MGQKQTQSRRQIAQQKAERLKKRWGLKHFRPFQRGETWWLRKGQTRLSLETTDEQEAMARAKALDTDYNERRLAYLEPGRLTLGQFVEDYLKHREPLHLSRATKNQDRKAFASLAGVLGQRCPLRAITQRKIDQWQGTMLTAGKAPETIRSYLTHILAGLNTAAEWGVLPAPPKIKRIKAPKHLPRALTPEQLQKVLSLELNPERRATWEFLVWTALRRAELCGLQGQDLYLTGNEPYMRVRGKGDKDRLVPLLPDAVRALETFGPPRIGPVFRYTPIQKAGKPRPTRSELAALKKSKSNVEIGHLFGVSDVTISKWVASDPPPPRAVPADNLTKWLKVATTRAGFPAIRLHDLRHTALTWMAARGVPEHIIQDIAGHESILTTQKYTQNVGRVANLYRAMQSGLDVDA